jgi:hypothetical protein
MPVFTSCMPMLQDMAVAQDMWACTAVILLCL